MTEYGRLRRLVYEMAPDWRLVRRSKEATLYSLIDPRTNAIIADGLTASEIGRWHAGQIGLASLRQPAKDNW